MKSILLTSVALGATLFISIVSASAHECQHLNLRHGGIGDGSSPDNQNFRSQPMREGTVSVHDPVNGPFKYKKRVTIAGYNGSFEVYDSMKKTGEITLWHHTKAEALAAKNEDGVKVCSTK